MQPRTSAACSIEPSSLRNHHDRPVLHVFGISVSRNSSSGAQSISPRRRSAHPVHPPEQRGRADHGRRCLFDVHCSISADRPPPLRVTGRDVLAQVEKAEPLAAAGGESEFAADCKTSVYGVSQKSTRVTRPRNCWQMTSPIPCRTARRCAADQQARGGVAVESPASSTRGVVGRARGARDHRHDRGAFGAARECPSACELARIAGRSSSLDSSGRVAGASCGGLRGSVPRRGAPSATPASAFCSQRNHHSLISRCDFEPIPQCRDPRPPRVTFDAQHDLRAAGPQVGHCCRC